MLKKYMFAFLCVTALHFSTLVTASAVKPEQNMLQEVHSISLGAYTVTTIEDMSGSMNIALFPGVDNDPAKAALFPGGSAASSVNVFLVQTGAETILIDTGWGKDGARKGSMPDCLQAMGISPESVDKVLLTHMHIDHISGLLHQGKAFFPKAQIIVSKPELTYWVEEGKGNKDGVTLARKVAEAYKGRVTAVDFGMSVAPGITAEDTVGHTPGHTAFLIESEGQGMLIIGDLLHAAALQFPYPEANSIYDVDPAQAAASRSTVLERLSQEDLLFGAMHVPFPGIGKVEKQGQGFIFTPLDGKTARKQLKK